MYLLIVAFLPMFFIRHIEGNPRESKVENIYVRIQAEDVICKDRIDAPLENSSLTA